MRENNLYNALLNFFSESHAVLLAELLKENLCKETIRYQEIDIVESQKKDLILKVTITQWFKKMKYPGSLINMVLFDTNECEHYIYHIPNNSEKLKSSNNKLDIRFEDS